MKAVVLFESSCCTTRRLALEIGLALSEHEAQVEICSVDDVLPELDDLDLLVVGVHGIGLFDRLPPLHGIRAAAFGPAAHAVAKRFELAGAVLVAPPTCVVGDARAWAQTLLESAVLVPV
jgi:hypothetical protein